MSTISTKLAGTAIALAAALAGTALPAAPAFASEHCKKVYLKVVNRTGSEIKVIDLDYWDPSSNKWRSEPTKNEVIPNGQVWQETRRLERVNAERTRLRVEYRLPKSKGFGNWGKKQRGYSGYATCSRGKVYQVVLN
ncbi:hypothetical protein FQ775_18020 [Nitratireductor mangrovi]|uniref:Uncharacterized protein n=1 Tax=Nitratireductor mangrovi TaxID=2599600 RepID=A0A5B8L288_9HYPH|nr:hypothetical protein [Nitratireductor mangrovi]QDZ02124.1 hypothetical protein FQ775_18020 [Nitratireductor mangrovi]